MFVGHLVGGVVAALSAVTENIIKLTNWLRLLALLIRFISCPCSSFCDNSVGDGSFHFRNQQVTLRWFPGSRLLLVVILTEFLVSLLAIKAYTLWWLLLVNCIATLHSKVCNNARSYVSTGVDFVSRSFALTDTCHFFVMHATLDYSNIWTFCGLGCSWGHSEQIKWKWLIAHLHLL